MSGITEGREGKKRCGPSHAMGIEAGILQPHYLHFLLWNCHYLARWNMGQTVYYMLLQEE